MAVSAGSASKSNTFLRAIRIISVTQAHTLDEKAGEENVWHVLCISTQCILVY